MTEQNWSLSLPEKHLVAELAVGLARRLSSILGGQDDILYPEPGYVWPMATSDFEHGCRVLWHLDVAVAAYPPGQGCTNLNVRDHKTGEGHPPYFKFLSADEIRTRILDGTPNHAPELDEILSAYLGVACGYGGDDPTLSSEREPFVASRRYEREIDALGRLGYLERNGDIVVWTDRVGPAMRRKLLWTEEGQSLARQDAEELGAACSDALARTPDLTKRILAREARSLSQLDFAVLLRDRFDGLFWSKNSDGTPRPYKDVRLVQAIYRSLREQA